MWASRLLKGRNARSSTKQTAAALASMPTSQTESSANSQAFSVAVAELMESLDFVLDQLDDQGEQGDLLRYHLSRIAKEISRYENSRVRDEIAQEWSCDDDLIQLVLAACRCACSVYKAKTQPGDDLLPIISRTPSLTGTVKATSIWKMDNTKTLFVSIRGTASATDHMVNFNTDRKNAASVFAFPGGFEDIFAHSGFLACANTLLPWLRQEIVRQVALDPTVDHVVFTGHSAGGAVAAIVFLHFVCHCPTELSGAKFSLITFGSPPVTSINVTQMAQDLRQTKHILAVVNEYDLVSRIDQSYLTSIIDLYRAAYDLPSVSTDVLTTNHSSQDAGRQWQLPYPDYHAVGEIVVMRARLDVGGTGLTGGSNLVTDKAPAQKLDMRQISPAEFSKLIFFEISVHKRRIYLERLEKMIQSRVQDSQTDGAAVEIAHLVRVEGEDEVEETQ
ncbi:hypothetical protein NM208_g4056 [Fusarium decemcellulare]|uniref:Uncharacterized protein n=1 Tax=Fusarium decemcellulare TaxID=57161 RepID=A0ACC1SMA8_9HYPO|nr:hypothetical protein NM208_g4056 [Fusarium decemcellulare]